ncbi:MAG: hypothetical protein HY645_12115 [Acidobacteria bacterium]|nr:hypothetical protein [Acidobacteriota bacterium]
MTLKTERPERWKRIAGTSGGVFLGAILLTAAIAKAVSPGAFAEQIQREGLDFLFPASVGVLIALALETALGLLLVLGLRRPAVLIPASALVAFFVFLTARNFYLVQLGLRDPTADCGCFGELWKRTPGEAFWQDLLILVPPLLLAFYARPRPHGNLLAWRTFVASLSAAVIAGFAWVNPDLRFVQAAQEIAASQVETGFSRTYDYVLVVDGQRQASEAVYQSQNPPAFLILTPTLSRPVLVEPRTGLARILSPEQVVRKAGDRVEVTGEIPETSVKFRLQQNGIAFSLSGHEFLLRDRTTADPEPRGGIHHPTSNRIAPSWWA